MNKTKTDLVRRLLVSGDYKRALNIVKGFRLGISKDKSDKIKLAYECMVHESFYKQIGKNTGKAVSEGIEILKELYDFGDEVEELCFRKA